MRILPATKTEMAVNLVISVLTIINAFGGTMTKDDAHELSRLLYIAAEDGVHLHFEGECPDEKGEFHVSIHAIVDGQEHWMNLPLALLMHPVPKGKQDEENPPESPHDTIARKLLDWED